MVATWLHRVALTTLVLGSLAGAAAARPTEAGPIIGLSARSLGPPTCADPPTSVPYPRALPERSPRPADTRSQTPEAAVSPAALRGTTWYRLTALSDPAGWLSGYSLHIGRLDGSPGIRIELPPESFAAGPFDGRVLVGSNDERGSALRLLDADGRCSTLLRRSDAIIRRAVVGPRGQSVYWFELDPRTRTDRGLWRITAGSDEPPERVLAPLPLDRRRLVGRVFSTELVWDLEGERLAVQSCGERTCLTRVIDADGGGVIDSGSAQQGELVGLAGSQLVHYLPCPGLPCSIGVTDLSTGDGRILAVSAGLARLLIGNGPVLAFEPTSSSASGEIGLLDLGTAVERRLYPRTHPGQRLVPAPMRAGAAAELPSGWILFGPDGSIPVDPATPSGARGLTLLRPADGTSVPVEEVT